MTIIECTVYHWTSAGMSTHDGTGSYVEVRDVEKLLETAHRRGGEAMRDIVERELDAVVKRRLGSAYERCGASRHPGTSPRGFQCVLGRGHDGDHRWDTEMQS